MQNTAKGQITLVSISDGSTALFYIEESGSTQQIHNTTADSWYPDYTASGNSLKLTPHLTINGTVPTSIKYYWYDSTTGTDVSLGDSDTTGGSVSTASSTLGMLTINQNLTTQQQRFLKCKATFNDPATGVLSTTYETVVLQRTDTAGSSVNVLLDCVTPNAVNSGIDGLEVVGSSSSIDKENDHVQLEATTLLGTSVYVNGTPGTGQTKGAIKYSWSYYNFHLNAFTSFGTNGVESSTGVTSNDPSSYNTIKYYKRNSQEGVSGVASENYSFENGSADDWSVKIQNNVMYLSADAIDVNESIRCTAYLHEVNTEGTAKTNYKGEDSDIQAVFDITDDYQLDVSASTTVLSSSVQSSVLKATITHDGKELTQASYNNILFDWDAYQYDISSGSPSYVMWPEYTLSDNTFTKVASGTAENGTGYWLSGSTLIGSDQTISKNTTGLNYELTGGKGKNTVTVYKDQVGANSRVEVVAYLKGVVTA